MQTKLTIEQTIKLLRERLITIQKPGAKPYDFPQGGVIYSEVGGEHKPGDSAGYQCSSLQCGIGGPSMLKMVEHIYAEEPLAWRAAELLEELSKEGAK